MYRPEYVAPGNMLLFREGRAKGVGRIRRVFTKDEEMGMLSFHE